jgi:putative peptidoglycan lipid II flippase
VVLLAPHLPVAAAALALGVIFGGLLQVATHWPSLWRVGYPFRPTLDLRDPGLRRMALLMLPATYGMAVYQIAVLVNRLMASYLPDGSISYLWYGLRLMQFPLGVFGVAISTAILPALSRQAASGDRPAFAATFSAGVRTTLFFALPATAGLILLAEPIISVLFERGAFTHAQVAGTATALVCYTIGLTAYALQKVVLTSFYATLDIRTPVVAGTVSLVIGILLNMILMGPLGHAGLALSTSASVTINFLLLAWLLRRRSGPLGGRRMAASLARILAATGVMCLAVVAARAAFPPSAGAAGFPALAGIILCGAAVYALSGRILGVREVGELKESFTRDARGGPE